MIHCSLVAVLPFVLPLSAPSSVVRKTTFVFRLFFFRSSQNSVGLFCAPSTRPHTQGWLAFEWEHPDKLSGLVSPAWSCCGQAATSNVALEPKQTAASAIMRANYSRALCSSRLAQELPTMSMSAAGLFFFIKTYEERRTD